MKVLFKSLVLTYHDIVVFLLHGMKNINLTSLSLSVREAGDNNVNISIAVVCGNSATKRERHVVGVQASGRWTAPYFKGMKTRRLGPCEK